VAWYDDESRLTYVATFDNPKKASDEADRAARKGWMPQGTAATDGHVNVGRTTLKVLTLGVPFLITGASRSTGKITLTFVRTPEWLSAKQLRDAARRRAIDARERSRRESESARRSAETERKALQRHAPSVAVPSTRTVGHVTGETPWYGKPDIFAAVAGTLAPGMRVEIRSLQGTFAWVQPESGPTCWITRAAISEGPPPSDALVAAVGAKALAGGPADPAPQPASDLSEHESSSNGATPELAPAPSSRPVTHATTFCGRCGEKRAHENDRFCQSCGAAL
jgi:hypothetical protein